MGSPLIKCHPGDLLWTRESWWEVCAADGPQAVEPGTHPGRSGAYYRADHPDIPPCPHYRPRVSIHMPRWASRMTLQVTDVRRQKLQDITETDALSEGVTFETADPPFYYVPGIWPHSNTAIGIEEPGGNHAVRCYAKLWDHLHGAGAWDSNPTVMAITFKVYRMNIDQALRTGLGRLASTNAVRPVLFSAPMIQALLQDRKTQTRRIA